MDAPLRRTPLEAEHVALGAKFGPFGGWNMPIEYAGVLAEHRAVREAAGLFDISHLGKVDVAGPEVLPALQRVLSNDLARVAVGRAQYHLLLREDGGVAEDLIVYRLDDERWFVVPNAANTATVVDALGGAGLDPRPLDTWCFLGVQGPDAPRIVASLFPGAADLPYFGCLETAFRGERLVLARTGYTGERGFELFCDAGVASPLWQALLAAGASPCGLGARDVLRLEMGYPLHGQDIGPDRTPLEAGLDWAVAMGKGPFVGRSALERQLAEGIPSRLRALVTEERRHIPRAHQAVLVDGRPAGEVTSGTFSPTRGAGIALAYLSPADVVATGDAVEIDVRGRLAPARVVELPFVDRSPR
ncbi:MAG: glycine cleavage system aminomethyltransferase GcvT [Actinomycetota bacterium]